MASLTFSTSVIKKLGDLNLRESNLVDVFNTGESIKMPSGSWRSIKKYSSFGYAIGIYYVFDNYSGGYKVTAVWKDQRR